MLPPSVTEVFTLREVQYLNKLYDHVLVLAVKTLFALILLLL